MRFLIINADDFGSSSAVNGAVRTCYEKGVITGVSVMACGKEFNEACAILQSLGKAEVGAHLTLTGKFFPCTDPAEAVRTLTRENGEFFDNYRQFAAPYFGRKIDRDEIYLEFANQIKKIKEKGLTVTHLDSHEHIHMFPGLFKITVFLADEFGIPYIRIPVEKWSVAKKQFAAKDILRHACLKLFALKARSDISGTRTKYNDAFWGHFHSGRVTADVLDFMMENLAEGVNELAVHPAEGSGELNALLSGGWKRYIDTGQVRLISHSQTK